MINQYQRRVLNALLWLAVALSLTGTFARLFAQNKEVPAATKPTYTTKEWQQDILYDPPITQVKMELSGKDAINVPGGARITELRIRTFAITGGEPQLIAGTPDCYIDAATRQITSTNVFTAHSGDGNFFVEGTGFRWQQESPDLTLSNDVHTILRQVTPGKGGTNATNSSTTQVYVNSHDATFDTKSSVAIYHQHVDVKDPHLHLTCVLLTAKLPQGSAANQLDHIVAESDVVIDFVDENGRKTHATSDRAEYSRTTEPTTNSLLVLTGNPKLETSDGWATADMFVMNQVTGKLEGKGNCHFHTRMNLDPGAGLTGAAVPAPETEIMSDSFEYDKAGLAIFHDHVRVNSTQIKLVCETLTTKLPGGGAKTNALNNIVAEKDVAIDYFDPQGAKTHATAEKMVYASTLSNGVTNKLLELSGNPVVERTDGWIMADLITMDQVKGIIRGEGNHHTILKKQAGEVSASTAPMSGDTEIFSDRFEFTIKTGVANYRGNARVLDPLMRLDCQQLMVKLPERTGTTNRSTRPNHIVAETNVVLDYFKQRGEKTHATAQLMNYTFAVTNGNTTNQMLDLTGSPVIDMTKANGEKTHATGDQAVYTSTITSTTTNEIVVLSGHPRVENAEAIMTAEEKIIYDRVTGETRSVGATQIVSQPGALSKTNNPVVPPEPTAK